jgi:hypothetical protein
MTFNASKHFEVPNAFINFFQEVNLINKSRELKSKIYLDKISDFKFFENNLVPKLTIANQ